MNVIGVVGSRGSEHGVGAVGQTRAVCADAEAEDRVASRRARGVIDAESSSVIGLKGNGAGGQSCVNTGVPKSNSIRARKTLNCAVELIGQALRGVGRGT